MQIQRPVTVVLHAHIVALLAKTLLCDVPGFDLIFDSCC